MSEVQKDAVTLEDVQNMPSVEGEEGTSEEEIVVEKEPEKKEEEKEKPPVPYDRFKEVNDKLNDTLKDIQDLKNKAKEEGLSEEEKSELKAKEYIERTAREAYEKMVVEKATADAERESGIKEEIKYYNSIDKDFTEKIAEDIGSKYGTEKNPVSIDVAYNIFKENKQLLSKISTPKPKVPNPIRSIDAIETPEEKANQGKSFWQVVQEAKDSLKGK